MNTSTATLQLLEAMHIYFQGEKTEALVFILPAGLLSLVFSAWLFTDGGGGFARGVAIPFLAMRGIFGVVGLVLRFATRGDLTQGLGIALVFFAGVGLLIDGFAERRTHPYTAALSAAQADYAR